MNENELKAAIEAKAKELEELKENDGFFSE